MNRIFIASFLLLTACELEPQGLPYTPPGTRVNMELVKNLVVDDMAMTTSTGTTFSVCHESTSRPAPEIPDGCRVLALPAAGGVGAAHSPQDVGGVKLSSMALGMLDFPVPKANNLCSYPYLKLDADYADGESITHSVTGGLQMDALSITVDAPSTPVLSASSLVRGQPWTLQWTGSEDEKALIWVRTTDVKEKEIICFVTDSGSITIAADQTNQLAANAQVLEVEFRRSVKGVAKAADGPDELVANVRMDLRQELAIEP